MSELQELKALLCECGLSKRQLLKELIDAVTEDIARCSQCEAGCINCQISCNTGPTAK